MGVREREREREREGGRRENDLIAAQKCSQSCSCRHSLNCDENKQGTKKERQTDEKGQQEVSLEIIRPLVIVVVKSVAN